MSAVADPRPHHVGPLPGQPATTGAPRHRGSFSATLQPPVCVQDRSPRGTRVFPSLQPELTSLYTWKTSLSRTIGQRRLEPKEALSGRGGPHTSGFTAVMSKLSASRAERQYFRLCGPYDLCLNYSALLLSAIAAVDNREMSGHGCAPAKLYLQK